MCGIFGMIGSNTNQRDRDCLRNLAYLSGLRGQDSTGLITVAKNKREYNVKHAKVLGGPTDDNLTELASNVDVVGSVCIIGHTRSATKGAVNLDNAQPVVAGHIYGVHNGTVDDLYDKKTDVSDSRMLYHKLVEDGVDVLGKVSNGMSGAFALVWYDEVANTVSIVRNSKRTLFYVLRAGVWFISSEREMLQFALKRVLSASMDSEIKEFEVGHLYVFDLTDTRDFTKTELFKEKTRTVTVWHQPYKYSDSGSRSSYTPSSQAASREPEKKEETSFGPLVTSSGLLLYIMNFRLPHPTTTTTKVAAADQSIPFDTMTATTKPDDRGLPSSHSGSHGSKKWTQHPFLMETITLDELHMMTSSDGCAKCGSQPSKKSLCRRPIVWLNTDDFLCSSCVKKGAAQGLSTRESKPPSRGYVN